MAGSMAGSTAGSTAGRFYRPGSAPSIDQHAFNWCGACYVVAVVQMLQDRWNVSSNSEDATFSIQRVMDEFDTNRHPEEEAGWNACHGGDPEHVIQCLGDGSCHLVSEATAPFFLGRVRRWCSYRGEGSRSVGPLRYVEHGDVKREIVEGGAVGLMISAEVLANTDVGGVVCDAFPLPADHVVVVVGWEASYWLIRNSWGSRRPAQIPDHHERCNTTISNTCVLSPSHTVRWHSLPSLPGHCLLPMSYTFLTSDQFFVADVT